MNSIIKIFIPIFLCSNLIFAQTKNKKTEKKKSTVKKETTNSARHQKLFTVKGNVTQTTSYCGGIAPTEEMLKEMEKASPYPNKNFYIKKGMENNLGEAVVLNFKTDAAGNYSFQIAPGIYVILLEPQLKALDINEYNQPGQISADTDCLKKWWSKAYYVLEIKDKDLSNLNFSFHHPCFISGDIPCLQYEGQMPP